MYDYSDKNKFEFIERNEFFEKPNFKIIEEKYRDIENNCEVLRKLRFKQIYKDKSVRLTKSQIECINERLKWDKFGAELTTPAETTICENEFMQYNPEILKSKKSKKFLRENNFSSYIEPILLDEKKNIDELMLEDDELYDLLKTNQDKYLEDCKKKRLEKLQKMKIKKKKYVPPSQRKPKNPNEIKSLKVSDFGFVDDFGEKYLYEFFKSFKIPKFKSFFPKYKENNKYRNICFLNFNSNSDATKALEKLKDKRLENSILSVGWANY